jgi:hypothetical protein
MMGVARIRRTVLLASMAVVVAAPAMAQSLTAARGPGYPVLPGDARSAALGSLGIGLPGFTASLLNPAGSARALRPGGMVVLESMDRSVQVGDAEDEVGSIRFPLIRLVFPVGPAVLAAGYGGYLDQGWGLLREGEETLGEAVVGYTDVMRSEGGVGQFQVGAAVPIGERFGLGAAVGLHMGSQRVSYSRRFDEALEGVLDPYSETLGWRYSGPMAQFGAQWSPADVVRIAASLTWAGTLVGEATEGRAARREVDLPLQVAAGASGVLVPGLLATVSGRWSGWSVTDPDVVGLPGQQEDNGSRDTWEVGGGLEWAPLRPGARRTFPVRAGLQYRQLPFPFATESPSEWFAGAGAGMRVGADPANPLAAVDVAVQRGVRSAAGSGTLGDLTERMWRLTLSVALFGN